MPKSTRVSTLPEPRSTTRNSPASDSSATSSTAIGTTKSIPTRHHLDSLFPNNPLGSRRARSAEFPEPHDGHAEAQPTNGGRLGHGCGYWSGCDRAGHAIGIGANGPGLINVVYNVGSRGGSSARDHEIPGEYRAVHGKCKGGGEGFSDTRVV